MQMNNFFSPGRFLGLLKEELRLDYRRYLIALGVIFGGLFIIWWFNAFDMSPDEHLEDFHYVWFGIILLGGGALYSSLAFTRFGDKPAKLFYLNLPASTFEKYASKWLLTAIFYPIVIWVLYLLFSWVVHKIHLAYTDGAPFTQLPVLGETTWLFIKLHIVIQSAFLLGAVIFHRYAIFKTIFSILVLEFALFAFAYICARLIFSELFVESFAPRSPDMVYQINDSFKNFVDTQLVGILKKVFWFLLAPFLLLVGFFKLKEKEV